MRASDISMATLRPWPVLVPGIVCKTSAAIMERRVGWPTHPIFRCESPKGTRDPSVAMFHSNQVGIDVRRASNVAIAGGTSPKAGHIKSAMAKSDRDESSE